MGIDISYNFDTPANYDYDALKIDIAAGVAGLKLIDNPAQEFAQDFAASTGFTFDAGKTEFSSGVMRQKDTRPAGAAFYAPYSVNIHGGWGNGTLTGTGTGSPAIVGGKLDLTGGVNKYVAYPAIGNVSAALQTGAIRFRVTPNYSGTPATRQNFFAIGGAGVSSNLTVYHDPSAGYLYISIYNSSGTAIYSSYIQAGLYWVPVSGTEYEFELNYDVTGGDIRLFINGTLWGVKGTGTGTRSAANLTNLWVGTLRGGIPAVSNNFSIRNFLCFDTVQHTANYTPDWSTIYDTIYVDDIITVPEMEYTGAGALVAATDFSTTQTGAMKYTVQIGRSGDYLYWNGSAWAVSNNTYTQANTAAEILANIATLDIDGEQYIQFRIYSTDGSTFQSIDALALEYTGETYPVDSPTIAPKGAIRQEDIEAFISIFTGAVKFQLTKNGVKYWHDGDEWVVSDGTYAQANTAAEVNTHGTTLTSIGVDTKWIALLNSPTGVEQASIEQVDIEYNYSGESPDEVSLATVWGYVKDVEGNPRAGRKVSYWLTPENVPYKNLVLKGVRKSVVSDVNGYFEAEVAETGSMPAEAYYTFEIGEEKYRVKMLSDGSYNLAEMEKI